MAQISFHNCHIPFIGTDETRAACAANETCRPPDAGAPAYTFAELDYYACLTELDSAVGRVLSTLETHGYSENTMVWFTTDNGPEVNCLADGICQGTQQRPLEAPGSAGPFRGRKRDVWEGGHRVPGIISWPAVIQGPGRCGVGVGVGSRTARVSLVKRQASASPPHMPPPPLDRPYYQAGKYGPPSARMTSCRR